jgi:hypothetical protein
MQEAQLRYLEEQDEYPRAFAASQMVQVVQGDPATQGDPLGSVLRTGITEPALQGRLCRALPEQGMAQVARYREGGIL